MKAGQLVLVVLLSVAASLGAIRFSGILSGGQDDAANTTESAYGRVMRTGTLRCGYFLYPLLLERDLKTGAMSGIMYEFVEEMGKRLSLTIDWAEETGFASAFDGLKAGRYDVVCMPFAQTPGRARVTAFTVPVIFTPHFLYARASDRRFDNAYEKANDPTVRIAILEGEQAQALKKEEFPKAQTVSMPDVTDISQVLLQVAMGKADAAITPPSSARIFLLKNPGTLKKVPGPSLRTQAGGLNVAVGEQNLKDLLNTAIESLHATGFTERIAAKYVREPDEFFLPAPRWGKTVKPIKETSP